MDIITYPFPTRKSSQYSVRKGLEEAHHHKRNDSRKVTVEMNMTVQCFELIETEWHIYASVNYSPFVEIMACRLVGPKPLTEPMMEYCWLCPQEQTSMKF